MAPTLSLWRQLAERLGSIFMYPAPLWRRWQALALHWQILIAVCLAVLAGLGTASDSSWLGVYSFIGTLFLNALKMVVVPLVSASIICGVSRLGGRDLGRLGGKTLVFYLATGLLAVTVGLTVINIVRPGFIDGAPAGAVLGAHVDSAQIESSLEKVAGRGLGDLVGVFLRMVPTNVVGAAAGGQMLALIFFSLLFGFFLSRTESSGGETMRRFWEGLLEVMMSITWWVMRFAPLGVFGLVAKTVTITGFGAFASLLWFFLGVLLALALHAFVTQPLILHWFGGFSWMQVRRHYRAVFPALLTAFSTASSSATLPVTLNSVRRRAGVSERTSSFIVPLGSTVNMDGTALYECAAVLFIAQAYGVDLSLGGQIIIVLTALLTSIGVAGIPSASLVAITVILTVLGLPLEGIGLLLVTDRVLDMLRTAVNVFGDTCGAVVIARLEGEEGVLEREPED